MISIYSDGSSSGGSGKAGGYGWIIVRRSHAGDPQELAWGYGGSPATTNNLMEMEGAIQGLLKALELKLCDLGEPIELVSDSQYTLGIASGGYSPSKNLEEAERLIELAKKVGCRFRWVRGHTGEPYNEGCDELANLGKRENTPKAVVVREEAKRAKQAAKRKAQAG